MLIIGLTGSIGMGKSAAAKIFRAHQLPVCDADAEVHKLYSDRAIAPIEQAFPGTTSASGVDRQKLAGHLLADPSGFKRLEAIVHPLVRAAEVAFLASAATSGAWAAVLEIPLLFETGGDRLVDVTVVVSAPPAHSATTRPFTAGHDTSEARTDSVASMARRKETRRRNLCCGYQRHARPYRHANRYTAPRFEIWASAIAGIRSLLAMTARATARCRRCPSRPRRTRSVSSISTDLWGTARLPTVRRTCCAKSFSTPKRRA